MGVSFKIAKNGSRFKPKPLVSEAVAPDNVEDASAGSSKIQSKNESNYSATAASAPKHNGRDGDAVGLSGSSLSSRRHISLAEDEVSFVLNLYLDGYSIGKPSDSNGYLASLQDGSKSLLPYDRSSETLFSAIEAGTLPGDVLDDIPCKFMNGTVICEVRDFRKCTTDAGSSVPSADIPPIFTKLRLRMSLENVVKDIPLIADDSWSYGDLMEVESRILKALQPKLCLDPTPRLDRLYENPLSSKISLGLSGLRKRRLMQMPDVTVTTNNRLHGKKICVGQPQEGQSYRVGASGPGDMSSQYAHESLTGQNIGPGEMLSSRVRNVAQDTSMSGMNAMPHPSKFPHGPGSQRTTHDPVSGSVLNPSSSSLPSASGQDVAISYNDSANSNSLPHGKMDAQEALMSQYSNKRTKIAGSLGSDSIHQQPIGSYMDSLQTSDVQWRNQGLAQQANLRGMPYGNTSLQKYPSLARDGSMNQDIASSAPLAHQGLRYGVSGEHVVPEKMDKAEKVRVKNDPQMIEGENNHMDPRFHQRPSPQAFMRPGFHQGGWNIHNQQVEKDSRKEEQIQRRKSAHNSRASAGGIAAQSSLSAKSADMASGSLGNQYAAVSSPAQHGYSQKSGNMGMPHHAVRSQSVTSSGNNDSMQHQQHQAQVAAKWRSNSLPKTPGMSGVGSPASVSNMSFPMNAASPSVSTPSMADQTILEKFTKIEMVTASHKLHRKRAKADEVSRKLPAFSAREVMIGLANTANIENLKDENCTLPLSRSIIGGSMNTSKIRVLTFMQPDRGVPGVAASSRLRTRLIMSEKPQEGTVAMHFGEIEDKDYLSIEDCLPSLPNTHYADLLASQLSTLMSREGYYMEDHIQPRPPTRPNNPLNNQQNVPGQPSEMQQSGETAPMSGQPANDTRPTTAPVGSPPNAIPNTGGMLSPGNPRGLQSSQGHIPGGSAPMRSQQMGDPNQPISQQQPMQLPNQQQMVQQNPQIQRSVLMPPNSLPQMNTMGPNSSLPMSNPMVNNKSSHLQMQNQPTQPQMQQSQTQRKMMMGLGTAMGMGNLANNMVGLGGLGNMMGIGGVGSRGMPVAGMSSPMGPIPGMGNLAQNPVGISQTSNLSAISQHLRSGALTPAHAQLLNSRMRMNQNRGMLGGPHQPGLAGLSGARNMQPGSPGLSMLGQALNRGSAMNPMQQRTALGMAAPRLMTGMNVHMNPQQQMQQLQQQQMQQLQQQQQMQQQMQQPQAIPQQAQQQQQPQQLQQQQEASSLQAVLSPQQVSSPSGGGVPQPPVNHLIAQSPQLSSGAVHNPPSNSNVEPVGPGSPQLSSQTLGSVGSITNSHGLTRGEQE